MCEVRELARHEHNQSVQIVDSGGELTCEIHRERSYITDNRETGGVFDPNVLAREMNLPAASVP